MVILNQIEKEKQLINRCEKSIALEKLKKRRADTRRKIELGGLVIKSGMDKYNKLILLGGLDYLIQLLKKDKSFLKSFEDDGLDLFL